MTLLALVPADFSVTFAKMESSSSSNESGMPRPDKGLKEFRYRHSRRVPLNPLFMHMSELVWWMGGSDQSEREKLKLKQKKKQSGGGSGSGSAFGSSEPPSEPPQVKKRYRQAELSQVPFLPYDDQSGNLVRKIVELGGGGNSCSGNCISITGNGNSCTSNQTNKSLPAVVSEDHQQQQQDHEQLLLVDESAADENGIDEELKVVKRDGLWWILFRQEKFLLAVSSVVQLLNVGATVVLTLLVHSFLLSLECDNLHVQDEKLVFGITQEHCKIGDGETIETWSNSGLWGFAFAIIGSNLVLVMTNVFRRYVLLAAGRRCRSLTMTLLFRKLLRVSRGVSVDVGTVLTLISNDGQKWLDAAIMFHDSWSAPLVLLSAFCLITVLIGSWAAVWCIFVQGMMFPLLVFFNMKSAKHRKQRLQVIDVRTRLCTELITGIRVVKCFGWETAYLKRVEDLRTQELGHVLPEMLWRFCSVCNTNLNPLIAMAGMFFFYTVVEGEILTPAKTFGIAMLVRSVRIPILRAGQFIMQLFAMKVSVKRMETFLNQGDGVEDNALLAELAGGRALSLSSRLMEEAGMIENSEEDGGVQENGDGVQNGGGRRGHTNGDQNGDHAAQHAPSSDDDHPKKALISVWNLSMFWPEKKGSDKTDNTGSSDKTNGSGKNTTQAQVKTPPEAARSPKGGASPPRKAADGYVEILKNLNVCFCRGELHVIMGEVGSGKTTFLNGLLGNAIVVGGEEGECAGGGNGRGKE